MTRLKICGIKRPETLALLKELDVDYVGLVFAPSKRKVDAKTAGRLLAAVFGHPPAVGVFVNPTMDELAEVLAEAPLSVIQLHGQETPEFCRQVRERFSVPVWKALAVGGEADASASLEAYQGIVSAFLFDTYDPAQAGGTGKKFSWEQIPLLQAKCKEADCIIAGGIHAENVAELIGTYQAAVIDVSSGVETDGEKDGDKIKKLVERVKAHAKQYTDNHAGRA
ncbi:N-(5'-phosphoribosyl)anthranilate isomerase [Brevibacillus agri]|uniref:N-(5'-phosphoribosyl)anthranilate isomerase n=1 Tax=Brevibacillus agri TaxID=51101 RepID=A0A3M8AQB0_9BACL|nr:phosphoribosylanthranilate isomerase [Brevibacillus agri]MCG5250025.1 phosphoribosylanthranilate isomerase [Brevibacillus agri]QAV14262.1 N-(5'-phosphoribosyl)anthranilate isomerase [Brevibacillus agri]RNB53381.1 phosphoribosylanthranilate isomerase [Brevibacillus agri]GED23964.1 N-(5'-phosphoribosyl)anthranilate isomerase [Brevibacillus agri]